jgi:hypothetical protein
MPALRSWISVGLLLAASSCNAGGEGPSGAALGDAAVLGASGLPSSRTLAALSDEDRATLCTWITAVLGGAGRTVPCTACSDTGCTDWNVTVNSVDTCVEALRTLGSCSNVVTVGQEESCTLVQGRDLCASPAECSSLHGCD